MGAAGRRFIYKYQGIFFFAGIKFTYLHKLYVIVRIYMNKLGGKMLVLPRSDLKCTKWCIHVSFPQCQGTNKKIWIKMDTGRERESKGPNKWNSKCYERMLMNANILSTCSKTVRLPFASSFHHAHFRWLLLLFFMLSFTFHPTFFTLVCLSHDKRMFLVVRLPSFISYTRAGHCIVPYQWFFTSFFRI